MKVKDFIKFLETQNPEDFICTYDLGQDTGDIMPIKLYKDNEINNFNTDILSYEKVIEYMRCQMQDEELEEFIKTMKREDLK